MAKTNQQIIKTITEHVEQLVDKLSDADYVDVLEGVACNLDASVCAKARSETRTPQAGIGDAD